MRVLLSLRHKVEQGRAHCSKSSSVFHLFLFGLLSLSLSFTHLTHTYSMPWLNMPITQAECWGGGEGYNYKNEKVLMRAHV